MDLHSPASTVGAPAAYRWLLPILVVLGVTGTQAWWLDRPFINQEFAFAAAGRALATAPVGAELAYFWHYQANPLGYPLLLSGLHRLGLPGDSFVTPRLPALAGGVMILLCGVLLGRRAIAVNRRWLLGWALVTGLHPMIFLYTGQATADILPTGLSLLALVCCCAGRGRGWAWHAAGGALFALAVVVKFNCLLLGMGFVYLLWFEPSGAASGMRQRKAALAWYVLLPALALGLYFLTIQQHFGIQGIPATHQRTHALRPSLIDAFFVLGKYLAFLGLFCGPLGLLLCCPRATASRRQRCALLLAAVLSALVGWLVISGYRTGEMDFGQAASAWGLLLRLIETGGLVLGVLLLFLLFTERSPLRPLAQLVLFTMLPYLLISSLTRPTQRYLLLVLPLVLLYLVLLGWQQRPRLTAVLTGVSVLLFAGLSALGMCYLQAQGEAALRMARWVREANLIQQTDGGVILSHVGDHFPLRPTTPPTYTIAIGTPSPQTLHTEPVTVWGRQLWTYVLTPVAAPARS